MSFLHNKKAGIQYKESEMGKKKPESAKGKGPFNLKEYGKPASQNMNLSNNKKGKK